MNFSVSFLILASTYSDSPIFSSRNSQINIKNSIFFRSFSSAVVNYDHVRIGGSHFSYFLSSCIGIDSNNINRAILVHSQMFLAETLVIVSESTFQNCISFKKGGGGAILLNQMYAEVEISECCFQNCKALRIDSNGGAVSNNQLNGGMNVTKCQIFGCLSSNCGQAIASMSSTVVLRINDSTLIKCPQNLSRNQMESLSSHSLTYSSRLNISFSDCETPAFSISRSIILQYLHVFSISSFYQSCGYTLKTIHNGITQKYWNLINISQGISSIGHYVVLGKLIHEFLFISSSLTNTAFIVYNGELCLSRCSFDKEYTYMGYNGGSISGKLTIQYNLSFRIFELRQFQCYGNTGFFSISRSYFLAPAFLSLFSLVITFSLARMIRYLMRRHQNSIIIENI